jgi:hypothetical protein
MKSENKSAGPLKEIYNSQSKIQDKFIGDDWPMLL